MISLSKLLEKELYDLYPFLQEGVKTKIIQAMRKSANQAIDECARTQGKKYSDLGYTNTGKSIEKLILNVKKKVKR